MAKVCTWMNLYMCWECSLHVADGTDACNCWEWTRLRDDMPLTISNHIGHLGWSLSTHWSGIRLWKTTDALGVILIGSTVNRIQFGYTFMKIRKDFKLTCFLMSLSSPYLSELPLTFSLFVQIDSICRQESSKDPQEGWCQGRQNQEACRILLFLYLQGIEAGSP